MISGVLIACALALLAAAVLLRRRTGLPWQRIATSDTSGWRRPQQPLISRRYGLVGKPDYLLGSGRNLVPVEVKPRRESETPYPSDVMQLAAYCLLVEETTGTAPPHGLLRYARATFKVRWDDRLRQEIVAVLAEIREADPSIASHRSHREPARCGGCGFVEQCEQALV